MYISMVLKLRSTLYFLVLPCFTPITSVNRTAASPTSDLPGSRIRPTSSPPNTSSIAATMSPGEGIAVEFTLPLALVVCSCLKWIWVEQHRIKYIFSQVSKLPACTCACRRFMYTPFKGTRVCYD